MSVPFRFKAPSLLVYAGFTLFAGLCSAYLGAIFSYIYLFLFTLPLFSLAHILLTLAVVRYRQSFNTNHPQKGQILVFDFLLSQEIPFPSALIEIEFEFLHSDLSMSRESVTRIIGPGGGIHIRREIPCRYRGVYTIGIKKLAVTGFLGMLSVSLPLWSRTFYVLPAAVQLSRVPGFLEEGGRLVQGALQGLRQDPLLFAGLRPYRIGEPASRIRWKKFAATGVPTVHVCESSSRPSVQLFLDTRSLPEGLRGLRGEDCAVEVLSSLVHTLLENRIEVEVLVGDEVFFRGGFAEDFNSFYQKTAEIYFNSRKSLLPVLQENILRGDGFPVVISAVPDPELYQGFFERRDLRHNGVFLSVEAGFTSREIQDWRYFTRTSEQTGLVEIRSDETLQQDLIDV